MRIRRVLLLSAVDRTNPVDLTDRVFQRLKNEEQVMGAKKLRPSGGYRDTCSFQTATSSQTELRLVNVARASQEELLLDYEDFLRHRHLVQWAPDSAEAMAVRNVPKNFKNDSPDRSNLSDLSNLTDHIPDCPQCGKPMVLRTAKSGKNEGQQFWGCSAYPECKGTAHL